MREFFKGDRAGGDWRSPGGVAEKQDLCVDVSRLHWSPYFCADAMGYQRWLIFWLCKPSLTGAGRKAGVL